MISFDGKKDPLRRQILDEGGEQTVREGWREFRKTTTIWARPMDIEFEVDTLEGMHRGKAGDFLAVGQAGEMYPIDGAVFAATYEELD